MYTHMADSLCCASRNQLFDIIKQLYPDFKKRLSKIAVPKYKINNIYIFDKLIHHLHSDLQHKQGFFWFLSTGFSLKVEN